MLYQIKLLFLTALWLLTVIVFIPLIFLPVLLFRSLVILCSNLFLQEPGIILPPSSGAYCLEDMYSSAPNGNIVTLIRVRGILKAKTMRKDFNSKILRKTYPGTSNLLYPELRQQTIKRFGFYFRLPASEFSLDHHIRDLEGLNLADPQTLSEFYEHLLKVPFKKSTSPWELILIPLPDTKQTFWFFRMHHSMGDGFSITQLLITDLAGYKQDKINSHHPIQRTKPLSILNNLRNAFKIPYQLVQQAVQCTDSNILFNPSLKLQRRYHLVISDFIQVDQVRKLKSAFSGSSFSSIIFTALTGALRAFHQQCFPHQPLPHHLHASTPLQLPNRSESIQNYHSFALIRLPTGYSHRRTQLTAINAWIAQLKASTLPSTNAALYPITGLLNHTLTKALTTNRFNTIITSIFPGPKNHCVYGDGHRVLEFVFAAGLLSGQQALGFFLITYDGKFRLVTTVDRALTESKDKARIIADYAFQELQMDSW